MKKASKQKTANILKNIYIALVFLFLFIPIIFVFVFSFNTSRMNIVWEGFTLQWYGSFLKTEPLCLLLKNTLIIAVVSTGISTIIGTLGAVGLYKYNFKGKEIIDKLLYIPIVIPEIVLGIALFIYILSVKYSIRIRKYNISSYNILHSICCNKCKSKIGGVR